MYDTPCVNIMYMFDINITHTHHRFGHNTSHMYTTYIRYMISDTMNMRKNHSVHVGQAQFARITNRSKTERLHYMFTLTTDRQPSGLKRRSLLPSKDLERRELQ